VTHFTAMLQSGFNTSKVFFRFFFFLKTFASHHYFHLIFFVLMQTCVAVYGRDHLLSSHVMFAIARDSFGLFSSAFSSSSSSSSSSVVGDIQLQLDLFSEALFIQTSAAAAAASSDAPASFAARCRLFIELLKASFSVLVSIGYVSCVMVFFVACGVLRLPFNLDQSIDLSL
jgi:hypothetical protein